MDRNLISRRTREALAAKKRRGEALGPTPYGYRRDGARLVEDPEEQVLLERIRQARAEAMSYRAIADALNAARIRPPRGWRWYPATVRRMADRL